MEERRRFFSLETQRGSGGQGMTLGIPGFQFIVTECSPSARTQRCWHLYSLYSLDSPSQEDGEARSEQRTVPQALLQSPGDSNPFPGLCFTAAEGLAVLSALQQKITSHLAPGNSWLSVWGTGTFLQKLNCKLNIPASVGERNQPGLSTWPSTDFCLLNCPWTFCWFLFKMKHK